VFHWKRQVFPNAQTYDEYEFLAQATPIPTWDNNASLGRYRSYAAAYVQGNPETQLVNPYAVIIRDYQKYVWLPGTIYGLILLTGLGGIVLAWRRLGGEALLPWAMSLALIAAPAATAEFDYRYVLPAVPFACLAAVIAFSPRTAGGAWARRLADAVRRTVGGSAGTTAATETARATETAQATEIARATETAQATGTGRVSAVAGGTPAEAGDDERDLAADGA
jgi:hypothetical protein